MEQELYTEMINSIKTLEEEICLKDKSIFLFAHCNATLELVDLLLSKGYKPVAILDNSREKQGEKYRGIKVVYPGQITDYSGGKKDDNIIVLIASRFYETMAKQLRELGFKGTVRKVIDYNTFAEYSLSEDTIKRMKAREKHGEGILEEIESRHKGAYRIFCPFNALGDIYFCMSYLPAFLEKRKNNKCVICVPSKACAKVVRLFGDYDVEVYSQKELDAAIQAVIYTKDNNSYIAHQDRPYVINLHKALYLKCIPLETVYKCGVFGLPAETKPVEPVNWKKLESPERIHEGKAVIISPYAKSVVALPETSWKQIIDRYSEEGYQIFTNVSGDEKPLPGTEELRTELNEMKDAIERAGIFIGIRSGLCDVIRTAKAKKIALYPDYYYSDTKWKVINMYSIDGFENIEVDDDFDILGII